MVPLETDDDFQLDFNRLYVTEGNEFSFRQNREIVPRKVGIDPI